jgi:GT2 family glycosyltransferase
MYQGEKIGVGIVTYNRKDGLLKLLNSLPRQCIDELVICIRVSNVGQE